MAGIGTASPSTFGPLFVAYLPEVFIPVDFILIDGTLSESDNLTVEWTKQPIEGGQTVSDFGIVQPETFSFTGMISGTPWSPLVTDSFSSTRVSDIPERLKTIARAKYLISIQTRRAIYNDYAITSITTTPVSGQDAVEVAIEFEHIRLVASATVSIPPLRIDPSAASIAGAGVDSGTAATATTAGSSAAGGAATSQSTAAGAFDVLASLGG